MGMRAWVPCISSLLATTPTGQLPNEPELEPNFITKPSTYTLIHIYISLQYLTITIILYCTPVMKSYPRPSRQTLLLPTLP